jgi:hypothetical protein
MVKIIFWISIAIDRLLFEHRLGQYLWRFDWYRNWAWVNCTTKQWCRIMVTPAENLGNQWLEKRFIMCWQCQEFWELLNGEF